MPYDIYANNINDKSAVIFDIGESLTKLGFSGESSPRAIIPSVINQNNVTIYLSDIDNAKDERNFLISFLYEIYYRKLLVNPKDRRVVLVESILNSTQRRELLANILFKHFEVPSILFTPIHLVSLFTVGTQSGLVVDCGYKEANTIPVYEGYHLLRNWQAAPLGSLQIEKQLASMIIESGHYVDRSNKMSNIKDLDNPSQLLTRNVLEDIKVRACAISPVDRANKWKQWMVTKDTDTPSERPKLAQDTFDYNLHCKPLGDICLKIPIEIRELAPECLFDSELEEITLASMMLDAILGAPIDCRRALCENILVIGGTCQIPGFKSRLLAEIRKLSKNNKYCKLEKETFKMHEPPSFPNYTGWLGAAIFGDLDTISVRSLARDTYIEKGKLPDWTDSSEQKNRS